MGCFLNKTIYYEWIYWRNKYPIHKYLFYISTILASLIVSLPSAKQFFEEIKIPGLAPILEQHKDKLNYVAAVIVLSPHATNFFNRKKENSRIKDEFSSLCKQLVFPSFKKDINSLYQVRLMTHKKTGVAKKLKSLPDLLDAINAYYDCSTGLDITACSVGIAKLLLSARFPSLENSLMANVPSWKLPLTARF